MLNQRPRRGRTGVLDRSVTAERVEVLLAACLVLLSVVFAAVSAQPWQVFVLDIAAYLTAALTPRWPRTAGTVLGLILLSYLAIPPEWATMGEYALMIAILGAGMRGATRIRTVMSVCYWAILTALTLKHAPGPATIALTGVAWAVLIATLWLVGNAFVAVTDAQRRAREAELALQRQHLARELHDTVARSLTSVTMLAERARLHGGATNAELDQIAESATNGLQELRLMMNLLRGPVGNGPITVVARTPLDDALTAAKDQLTRHGFQVTLSVEGDLGQLDAEQAGVLGAAAAEAVENMVKHGDPDAPCAIAVDLAHGACELVFINRPREPRSDSDPSMTLGVWGMGQRLAALGGEVTTESSANWVTRVRLPLSADRRSGRVA